MNLYAVATFGPGYQHQNNGEPTMRLLLIEAASEDDARTQAINEHQRTGPPAFGSTVPWCRARYVPTPVPVPEPELVQAVRVACDAPLVSALFLVDVLRSLCKRHGARDVSPVVKPGDPADIMVRFHAGLAMAEAAWREIPVQNSNDPYAGFPDGH